MPCRFRKNAMHSKIERGRFLGDQGFPKNSQDSPFIDSKPSTSGPLTQTKEL